MSPLDVDWEGACDRCEFDARLDAHGGTQHDVVIAVYKAGSGKCTVPLVEDQMKPGRPRHVAQRSLTEGAFEEPPSFG
jgi:hypothetical protein